MEKYQQPQTVLISLEETGLICQSESSKNADGLIYNLGITDYSGDL